MATPEIPKKQKAAVFDQPGTVSTKVVEIDVPEPGTGEVLINLSHSGVCHSDYGIMTNSWSLLPFPTQPGQVGGHEGVGRVAKLGPGCENAGLKIGDRVGVKWIASACGNCANLRLLQARDFSTVHGRTCQLRNSNPGRRPPEQAAPMLCAGVTVYAALKRSNARPGQWVVISGAGGGLGHLAVQLASRGMGLRVIGIDHGSKAELVTESGAEHFVDITQFPKDDNGEALKKHVHALADGLGVHAAVVCTAANAAYAQALPLLRFNGTLVCVGIPEHEPQAIATACPNTFIGKHYNVTGSAVGNRTEAIETMKFAARGIIKAHLRVEKMDALTSVFQEMAEGRLQGRVVLDLS
ncbi:hypothetical protein N7512_004149 [Penicillium capsulatum]|nr:hypothetical protein N7512_004149 [Penicillium capsulatum]